MTSSVIFVYGSLKRGYALHHLLRSAEYLGPADTQPLYRLFDLGSYPGLVEWPEGLEIQGELYAVTADVLRRLDEAEAVSEGLYARRTVQLQPTTGQLAAEAWFWLGAVSGRRDCGHSWPAG